ncbi:DUF5082 family protein [Bacillus sp. MUM 13]|uniref:DUF5082 family protein n=1 Tax=Bacillus sp. MUM 13 TaxID=1678001 RepID=UPI0008F56B39|nr:DUF5082 family protein [Bacillus sp. MUM 13]OIK03627.1 hypothetical protein BIV59_22480 [Bacillus sp. MUM 13]
MEVTDSLTAAHHLAASAIAKIDEQITRLNAAKADITSEQTSGITEIKAVLDPDLGKSWTGDRADKFEKARNKAHKTISNILNDDYDHYISEIEQKIAWLEIERAAVAAVSAEITVAEKLIEKGEKPVKEVAHFIHNITKKVF